MEQGEKPPLIHSSKRKRQSRIITNHIFLIIQRFFSKIFSLIASSIGLKKMAPACSSLLIIILIGLITVPSINISQLDQVAYADVAGIQEEFLFLEGEFISKPFVQTGENVRKKIVEYKIKPGDNISSIASQFGISTNTILWANNIYNPDTIKPGQTLKILPVTGILYKIKKGDSISKLAKKYEVSPEIVLHQNELDPEKGLIAGTKIVLPGAVKPKPIRSRYISSGRSAGPINGGKYGYKSGNAKLVFPTKGVYTQGFSRRHFGVDIANPAGPAIYAAESGCVVKVRYSGWNGGYGEHIILDHGNGMRTLYAHMREEFVKQGQCVGRGEAIGLMGNTGRSTGTHLHFEVIINGRKSNPKRYF